MKCPSGTNEIDGFGGNRCRFSARIKNLEPRASVQRHTGGSHLGIGLDRQHLIAIGKKDICEHSRAGANIGDKPAWLQATPCTQPWQQDLRIVTLAKLVIVRGAASEALSTLDHELSVSVGRTRPRVKLRPVPAAVYNVLVTRD